MECPVRCKQHVIRKYVIRPGATRRASRRGWDSNPRKLALRWFSRPVLSSAQSPLQSTYLVLRIRYGLRPGATRRAPRRGWDLNPRDRNRPNGFRDRHIRPLCHPSRVRITYPRRNTLYVIRNTGRRRRRRPPSVPVPTFDQRRRTRATWPRRPRVYRPRGRTDG